MVRGVGVMVVLTCCLACKQPPASPPAPPVAFPPEPSPAPARSRPLLPVGPLRKDGFVTYALYFVSTPKVKPGVALKKLARKSPFSQQEKPEPREEATLYGWEPSLAEATPPTAEQLGFFGRGFTPEQRAELASPKSVFAVAFRYPALAIPAAPQAADELINALATATGGVISDAETREVFSLDAFRSSRLGAWKEAPADISAHVTVHAYRDGDAYRAISLGMSKLGLPDVCVNRFAGDRVAQVAGLLRTTTNALHATPFIAGEGRVNLGDLHVAAFTGELQDGDNDNRLIELDASPALLDRFATREEVFGARADDTALLAASRRAKERLPQLRARFPAQLAAGLGVRVKAPFVQGDEREYMWVSVQQWEGATLRGALISSPRIVTSLVAGSVVTVKEEDIFDWVMDLPDGGSEGDETTRVLRGEP